MRKYGYTNFGYENNLDYGVYPPCKIFDTTINTKDLFKTRATKLLTNKFDIDRRKKRYLEEKETLYNDFLVENNLNNFVYHKDRPTIKAKIFPKKLLDEKTNQEEIFMCYQTSDNIGFYPKYVKLAVNVNVIDIHEVMAKILDTYYLA